MEAKNGPKDADDGIKMNPGVVPPHETRTARRNPTETHTTSEISKNYCSSLLEESEISPAVSCTSRIASNVYHVSPKPPLAEVNQTTGRATEKNSSEPVRRKTTDDDSNIAGSFDKESSSVVRKGSSHSDDLIGHFETGEKIGRKGSTEVETGGDDRDTLDDRPHQPLVVDAVVDPTEHIGNPTSSHEREIHRIANAARGVVGRDPECLSKAVSQTGNHGAGLTSTNLSSRIVPHSISQPLTVSNSMVSRVDPADSSTSSVAMKSALPAIAGDVIVSKDHEAPLHVPDTNSTRVPEQPSQSLRAIPNVSKASEPADAKSAVAVVQSANQAAHASAFPAHGSFSATATETVQMADEALRAQRAPLVDMYGAFIAPSDCSLAEARLRLETALRQTRELRSAFTERVYGKYRVCLKPPPTVDQVIADIAEDPVAVFQKLQEEMSTVKEEKEIEKKEAAKLNAELSATSIPAALNVDNAEQLMYFSAGLNLVMLPEQEVTDPEQLRGYSERGPINPDTGQRVKFISQAAATAGEVMLDRTRKAAAMRVERQRRWQIQLMSGEPPDGENTTAASPSSYSRLSILAGATPASSTLPQGPAAKAVDSSSLFGTRPSTISPVASVQTAAMMTSSARTGGGVRSGATLKQPPSGSSGPSGKQQTRLPVATTTKSRSRSQSNVPVHVQLSLSPAAEEINKPENSKVNAATAGLLTRGVLASTGSSTSNRNTQQRLRHPHPESLGGRRRAAMNPPSSRKEASSHGSIILKKQLTSQNDACHAESSFPEAYLALTLPPLPAAKERVERKRLTVSEAEQVTTKRARKSVQAIMAHFVKGNAPTSDDNERESRVKAPLCNVTKIHILNEIRKLSTGTPSGLCVDPTSPPPSSQQSHDIAGITQAVPLVNTTAAVAENNASTTERTGTIDPVLTFCVLHAVGLIARSDQSKSIPEGSDFLPPLHPSVQAAPWSEKLRSLRERVCSGQKRTLVDSLFSCYADKSSVEAAPTSKKQRSYAHKEPASVCLKTAGGSGSDGLSVRHSAVAVPLADSSLQDCHLNPEFQSIVTVQDGPSHEAAAEVLNIRGGGDSLHGEADASPEPNLFVHDEMDGENSTSHHTGAHFQATHRLELNSGSPVPLGGPHESFQVTSIRGGGEVLVDASDDSKANPESGPQQNDKVASEPAPPSRPSSSSSNNNVRVEVGAVVSNGRRRSSSSPGRAPPPLPQGRPPEFHGIGLPPQHDAAQIALFNSQLAASSAATRAAVGNHVPGYLTPTERYHGSALNALHLANQLRGMQHPAGDLADYIGSLHQQHQAAAAAAGYDLSGLATGTPSPDAMTAAHSSLAALGMARHNSGMVGYVQDRAAAARAMYAREQQAAALLSGATVNHSFAQSSSAAAASPYPHVGQSHTGAVTAALLGSSNPSGMLARGQYPVPSARSSTGAPLPTPVHHQLYPPPVRSKTTERQLASSKPRDIASMAAKPRSTNRDESSQRGVAGNRKSATLVRPSSAPAAKPNLTTRLMATETAAPTNHTAPVKEQQPNAEAGQTVESKPPAIPVVKPPAVPVVKPPVVKPPAVAVVKPAAIPVVKPPAIPIVKSPAIPAVKPPAIPVVKAPAIPAVKPPAIPAVKPPAIPAVKPPAVKPPAIPTDISRGSVAMTEPKINNAAGQVRKIAADVYVVSDERGMKFFVPKKPPSVDPTAASLIRGGRFHEAAAFLPDSVSCAEALEYLVSVGAAVPIPKALVFGPLKERLSTPGFKNTASTGTPTIPRELVVAAILVWLWANHEKNFQQAFEKSGRIDVDPDCKWIIQAAVDTAVRELTLEIAESMARGEGPFAEASASRKAHSGFKGSSASHAETDRTNVSRKLEAHTAAIVSKALMTELSIDGEVHGIIPQFQLLVDYLDEARLCALRAKAQERTLLASLVARRATMTETFSNVYMSSMVRAGEVLGHGKLFEAVQNEEAMASTMMPYDIFTDELEVCEDPCKPDEGFTVGLAGEELMRRAHARAMIHKSLRKLQDRNNIKGGAYTYGPYSESSCSDGSGSGGGESGKSSMSAPSPRPGLKRRISSIYDPPMQPGTGSAEAKSWAVYDPKHFSAPLDWDAGHVENTPYGRHVKGDKVRSLSLSLSSRSFEGKGGKRGRRVTSSVSTPAPAAPDHADDLKGDNRSLQSTREIEWAEIAGIFQRVELPKKSPPSKSSHGEAPVASRNIFAPFCHRMEHEIPSEDESDTEEDLSDEAVLARHQVVLDKMKANLSAFLEARKKQQERRRSRNSKDKS